MSRDSINQKIPNQSKKFEIVEALKRELYCGICGIIILVWFMILVSIVVVSGIPDKALVALLIIWPIVIGVTAWFIYYMRGFSKIRSFTITDQYIEIKVPHKPYFRVNTSEFDSIEITKRESMTSVPTTGVVILGPKFVYFNLIFSRENFKQSYEFESGKDFKVRSRKKILIALEQYAKEKNKNFTGYKWKDKRKAKKALQKPL